MFIQMLMFINIYGNIKVKRLKINLKFADNGTLIIEKIIEKCAIHINIIIRIQLQDMPQLYTIITIYYMIYNII